MLVDTRNLVSMTEANQNFSRVAHLVDERGSVVILRNNVPRYIIFDIEQLQQGDTFEDAEAAALGRQIIAEHHRAFEALAR